MKDLRTVGEQLLPVIAYGDAAGLPYEHLDRASIENVTGLRDTSCNTYLGTYPAGTWSDDTHLSLAVMKSLSIVGHFDIEHVADAHMYAYSHALGNIDDNDWICPIKSSESPKGWGKSTIHSVERLQAGVPPLYSGEHGGAGNGVLMKLAPIVLWQSTRGFEPVLSTKEIDDFTEMTHASPAAKVTSQVHRLFMIHLLMAEKPTLPYASPIPRILNDAYDYAKQLEIGTHNTDTSRIIGHLATLAAEDVVTPDAIEELTPGGGFYAPETLGRAYGAFCLEDRFPESVYRAVEIGGDTDSIGSIVGTMSLFLHGKVEMPKDMRKLFAIKRLQRISRDFTAAALGSHT